MGYCGGTSKAPTYRNMGDHTEAIQVDFDSSVLAYDGLLKHFWSAHNPLRPGSYVQYKAILWTHGDEQRRIALASRNALTKSLGAEVKTEIAPYKAFHLAEDYHQKYRLRQVARLTRSLRSRLGSEAALRDSTLAAKLNAYVAGYGTPAQLEKDLATSGLNKGEQEHLRAIFKKSHRHAVSCGG